MRLLRLRSVPDMVSKTLHRFQGILDSGTHVALWMVELGWVGVVRILQKAEQSS